MMKILESRLERKDVTCVILEANNIAYIAHDRARQKFVIWGEHHKMNKVKNELIARINIV